MSTSDNDQKPSIPQGEHDGRTVIMQRCPKHGIAYLPKEGCPECAKEKSSSAG